MSSDMSILIAQMQALLKAMGLAQAAGLRADFLSRIINDPDYRARFVESERRDFKLLHGAAPRPSGRVIDCDAAPFIPDGWRIDPKDQFPNVVRGQVAVEDIKFHLDESQKMGTIVGSDLKPKLMDLPVLGAQALDHFLANTNQIPESWKTVGLIFFWGTIYRRSGGGACVRCLCWGGGRWGWGYDWLGGDFGGRGPAAVL